MEDKKHCVRCGYPAQFNWSGFDVCGMGCYELLMLIKPAPRADLGFAISRMLGDSVQGVQDAIENIFKAGEHVKIPSMTYSRYYPASDTWVIELNRYHRDNLVWLLNAIGYGEMIEPFNFANTGDWVGEIHGMLPNVAPVPEKLCSPNKTSEELKQNIEAWLKSKR
jgi:hypothetical protein